MGKATQSTSRILTRSPDLSKTRLTKPRSPLLISKVASRRSRTAMIVVLADTFVPIFVGLLLGYVAGLWKFVDNQNVRTLITFVMSVALPCSLFGTIGQLSRAAVEQQGEVVAVLGITYVAVFLVVYFWAARWERFSPAQSAVLALTLSYPNVDNQKNG